MQGQPVIAQAGGSPRGRQFASQLRRHDRGHTKGVAAMKAYRDDVRARMVAHGRDPERARCCSWWRRSSPKRRRRRRRSGCATARAEAQIPQRLAHLGKMTNIDFGGFDLDKPLPDDVTTNGHQQTLDEFRGKWRPAGPCGGDARPQRHGLSVELVGTPDSVAARMGEVMEEVGGDGFLFSLAECQPSHPG